MILNDLFEIKKCSWVASAIIFFACLTIVGCLSLYVYHGFQLSAVYLPLCPDYFNFLVAAKMIAKDGWWFFSPELSWPAGLNYSGFAVDGNFTFLIFKIISLFTSDPFAITAYAISVSSIICFVLSYFFLTLCGANRFTAGVFSIIFAFSPAFFYRSVPHFHSVPYFVPITCGVALLIYCDRIKNLCGIKKKLIFFLCFLLGFAYAYTVVFSMFFFSIALMRQCILGLKNNKTFKLGIIAVLCFIVGASINLSPTLYQYYNHPDFAQKMSNFKNPSEADFYGLYIRTLFRPVQEDTAAYNPIENIYKEAGFDRDTGEQLVGRLGAVASLGVVFILFYIFFKNGLTHDLPSRETSLFYGIGILILCSILLAVPGGIGSMINMFTPQIRCYNRISPYIGYLSITCLAAWLSLLMSSHNFFRKNLVRIGCLLVGLSLVFFSVCIDQRPYNKPMFKKNSVFVSSTKSMLDEFKPYLNNNAKIFFIPTMLPYPNTPGEGKMMGQIDSLPYILSNSDYSWSIMPLLPKQESLIKEIIHEPGSMIEKAKAIGFDAFLVDNSADTPQVQEIIRELETSALEKHLSFDGKYTLFAGINKDHISKHDSNYKWDSKEFVFTPLPNSIDLKENSNQSHLITFLDGWSHSEPWGRWSKGYHSVMSLKIPEDTKSIQLYGHTFVSEKKKAQRIIIKHNGKHILETWLSGNGRIVVPVPEGLKFSPNGVGTLNLEFEFPDAFSPASIGYNGDNRILGFGLERIDFSKDYNEVQVETLPKVFNLKNNEISNSPNVVLAEGWSIPEQWGVWSNGWQSSIFLKIPEKTKLIKFKGHSFSSKNNNTQRVIVRYNDTRIFNTALSGIGEIVIPVPEGVKFSPNGVGILKLNFEFPDAISPFDIGLNGDKRILAFGMESIELE